MALTKLSPIIQFSTAFGPFSETFVKQKGGNQVIMKVSIPSSGGNEDDETEAAQVGG